MPKKDDDSVQATPTRGAKGSFSAKPVGPDAQEQRSLEQISQKLDLLQDVVERCLDKFTGAELLPFEEEVFRRQAQHGSEHRAIAKRCCDLYVKDHARFFIQGAPMGLELAREISRRNTTGCYIATNSTFVKTILKPRREGHGVLDFAGGVWDSFDGAEVFSANDERYWPAFQKLFNPAPDGGEQIDLAIVAPVAVCPEKGPFFHRAETAYLVDTIWNVRPTRIVVLASFKNVYTSEHQFPEYSQMYPGWRSLAAEVTWGREIHLITAGSGADARLADVVEAYRDCDGSLCWHVDWLDDATGQWDDTIRP